MEKITRIIEIMYKDPAKTMLALKLSLLAASLLIGILKGDPIDDDSF